LASRFDSVDYAELRDAEMLEALGQPQVGARLFVAARIGGTRLIDNMGV
jgi:pantoate--beta-alanine ligase